MEGKKNFKSASNNGKALISLSEIEKCPTNRVEAQELLQKDSRRIRRKSSKRQIKSKAASQSDSFELKTYKRKPKTIWCDLCPKKKSFTSKVLFNRHKLQIHGFKDKRVIICEVCSAELKSVAYYKRHMETRHPKIVKVFTCDNCGKNFDHKDYLRTHVDRHRRHQILTCIVCQKSYISKHTFRRHLKTHLEKFICTECGVIFHQKLLLDNHFASKHSNELPHKCQFCTRQFPSKISRNNHQYAAHKNSKTELNFKCNECNIYFEMKEELRIHSFIHFNGDIKTCHECHQIFKTNRLLNIHMQKHETNKTIQCTQCGDFFTFKSGLAKHVRLNRCKGASNFGDESFKLDDEKIAEIALSQLKEITKAKAKVENETAYEFVDDFDNFSDESTEDENIFEPIMKVEKKVEKKVVKKENKVKIKELIKDENSKESRKIRKKKVDKFLEVQTRVGRAHLIYTCDHCGESIKFKKNIQEHMKQHVVRYRCKECQETFKSRKKLVDHSIEAHGVKPQVVKEAFSCEFCGRKFDVRSSYEAHKLSHDDTARHKICSICSAAFKSVGNLRRHEATHVTTRDFHCESCPKSFKTHLALKIHKEVVHAEMKVFVNCGICQAIVQEKHLNQHIKNQHTEEGQEKPFECSACGKTFRTFQLGQRHYEAVHETKDRGIIYTCPHCPELQFFRQRELKEHSFIHFDGTIFQCDECLKMFKSNRLLMMHRASHNEVGGFPCKICDNIVFKTRGGLRKHMLRLHTDDKIEIEELKQNEESEKQTFVIVNHQILRH